MTPYHEARNRSYPAYKGGRMLVELKNGLKLSLPDTTPREMLDRVGYFVLDGRPCANPDLSITPAIYAICEDPSDVYELYKYEIVLGTSGDVV